MDNEFNLRLNLSGLAKEITRKLKEVDKIMFKTFFRDVKTKARQLNISTTLYSIETEDKEWVNATAYFSYKGVMVPCGTPTWIGKMKAVAEVDRYKEVRLCTNRLDDVIESAKVVQKAMDYVRSEYNRHRVWVRPALCEVEIVNLGVIEEEDRNIFKNKYPYVTLPGEQIESAKYEARSLCVSYYPMWHKLIMGVYGGDDSASKVSFEDLLPSIRAFATGHTMWSAEDLLGNTHPVYVDEVRAFDVGNIRKATKSFEDAVLVVYWLLMVEAFGFDAVALDGATISDIVEMSRDMIKA